MASTMRPRGPLPARVYWTRRIVVLAVPLLLVVVLARVLGGSSDGKDASAGTATQAGATVAEPTGPCSDADIVATPVITSAPGGSDIPIQVNLRTTFAEACTWRASPETMTVTITSGDDYIWSTRECPVGIPPQDVVIRQAVDTPLVVTWSAKRSDATCSPRTQFALPGFYHVKVAALGGEPTDVQFELVPPQPGVVTKTADPQPQGKGGKKNGETSHTPGEDGAGNSEG